MSTLLSTGYESSESGEGHELHAGENVTKLHGDTENLVEDDEVSIFPDMEDIEVYFNEFTTLAPEVPAPKNGNLEDDSLGDMKKAISLAKEEIKQLSLYVASAPENDHGLKNKRICLKRKTNDLIILKKAFGCFEDTKDISMDKPITKSLVVPRNLPMFRWEGLPACGPEGHIFVDVKTCLMNFVDVMNSHGLVLDDNYLRVLPPLLFGATRIWFEDYLNKFRPAFQRVPSWQEFSVAIQERYGLNAQEERNNCARELNVIMMLRTENMEAFIDRFNSLRRRAVDQVLPDSLLVERFLSAIPAALSNQVTTASATLALYKQNDVDIIAALARSLFNRIARQERVAALSRSYIIHPGEAARTPKGTVTTNNNDDEVHRGSRLSRHASNNTPTGENLSSVPVPPRPFYVPRPRARVEKYCSFHRANTHNTADCRAANAQSNEQTSSSVEDKKCYSCGVSGWTRNHVCNTARREEANTEQEYNFGAMSFGSDRVEGNNYAADAAATTEHAATIGAPSAWANANNTVGTIIQHASPSGKIRGKSVVKVILDDWLIVYRDRNL
ncbi:uncharacterized protein EV154DRAFT_483549 [Mucor mucedo]|uniref:uncharacterized protein n=1 Tax=Mucor mucedo TaxID=29922 RepID=UPI00221F0298|nr:uncharacterized protein EV154DRAFT_483549 [Mucor mucedo]KAI7889011.1 hypothetical protein EV154DRAFT_483549 [Mucor mucedo]